MKGKIGTPAHVVSAIPAGLDERARWQKRQDERWAEKAGEVTVEQLSEDQLAARRAAARRKRASTSPLREAPAPASKISAPKPGQGENGAAESGEWIEFLLEQIFG